LFQDLKKKRLEREKLLGDQRKKKMLELEQRAGMRDPYNPHKYPSPAPKRGLITPRQAHWHTKTAHLKSVT